VKNILLIFLNNLKREKEFNSIVDEFDKHGYKLYLLDNIKEAGFFIFGNLPTLLGQIYNQEDGDINKVVILSNSRDLILSWYRSVNSLVDDFIYFIDENEENYFTPGEEYFEFYRNLSEFDGIENETIEGKIYLNINFNNYSQIIDFLGRESNFRFFTNWDNSYFDLPKIEKERILKKYIFNGQEYSLKIYNMKRTENVMIKEDFQKKFSVSELFLKKAVDNPYIIPYLTRLFCKPGEKTFEKILLTLFTMLKETETDRQNEVFKKLFAYIRDDRVGFKDKIYIFSLLVMIHNGNKELAEYVMSVLLKDVSFIKYHFPVILNIFSYQWNEKLKLSNKVYAQIREEIIKLGKFFKKQARITVNRERDKSDTLKVAIHYDQLLSLKHAPTLLALEMAKNLKKYCKKCEVKIFVEDNFISSPDEIAFPYAYSSIASLRCKKIHEEYLKGSNIQIYYSNPSESKMERTKSIVNEINKFNPTVIYSTSDVSLAREILYPYYPIVYQTHGGTNFSTLCDVYVLYGNSQKEKLLYINNDINLIDENKIHVIEQPVSNKNQAKKSYRKSDLGLKDDSFLMVTVGNRLNADLSGDFIDLIASFILEKDNVVWILVGPKKIPYVMNEYKNLIHNKKIIKIDYEEDLLSLYEICDVYINPVRNGGAGSVVIAMQSGIPSIVEKKSQDSVFVIGRENCVDNDKEAYINELEKLYSDIKYRKDKGELMKKIITNKQSWGKYIREYLKIFELARKSSCKRNVSTKV
jgi:glycosyltransferase involved in cell wall biosynthesis